jgi:hypothetical protein
MAASAGAATLPVIYNNHGISYGSKGPEKMKKTSNFERNRPRGIQPLADLLQRYVKPRSYPTTNR